MRHADIHQIDALRENAGLRPDLFARTSQQAVTFLRAELAVGHTFADLAMGSRDTQAANRCRKSSRKAYETVDRYLARERFIPQQGVQTLREELQLLKDKLVGLDGKF